MNRATATALISILTGLMIGGPAWAQDTSNAQEARPAIASVSGDTGLWFVPTAEVLKSGGWSFGLYRTEVDFNQGFTNVSYYPATIAIGVRDRAEIFGALHAVTAIDRDARPILSGGVVNEYPLVRQEWTGSDLGDLFLGTKINLLSEQRLRPIAMAFRATVKLPTAGAGGGVGTGQFDYMGDLIASKEVGRRVELSGFGGFILRGDPDDVSLADGFRWGLGAAFGARSNFRVTTELHGEVPVDDTILVTEGALVATDGSIAPVVTSIGSRVNAAVGLTWQHPGGVSLGVGMNYRFGLSERSEVSSIPDVAGDAVGVQFRLGFHGGVRVYVPPAPPRPVAPPPVVEAPRPAAPPVVEAPRPAAPVPAANRQPTVRAECDPCRVEVGQAITVRATGQDPDGDVLSSRWSVSSGTIADPRAATTRWTAETLPGTVVLTVTTEDGRGGTASDKVSIEVIGAQVQALADVQFDLGQAAIRPDALNVLNMALKILSEAPARRLQIEGHASDDGTAEFNRLLSERRALAVRDYLASRGIDPSRLSMAGYGEDRPKYDSSQEATRRLNRRVALIIQDR